MNIENSYIEWLGHASFRINKNIYIDPYQIKSIDPAKIILITHSHFDHCSTQDIAKIVTSETVILAPPDCLSKLRQFENVKLKMVEPNSIFNINDIKIKTVPAYNINKQFHPKANDWVGYIIEANGDKIYHAGDTDIIPEMSNIQANIALLPIGGKYTMDFKEAAHAAQKMKVKHAIPMHYGSIIGTKENAQEFKTLANSLGVRATILES